MFASYKRRTHQQEPQQPFETCERGHVESLTLWASFDPCRDQTCSSDAERLKERDSTCSHQMFLLFFYIQKRRDCGLNLLEELDFGGNEVSPQSEGLGWSERLFKGVLFPGHIHISGIYH